MKKILLIVPFLFCFIGFAAAQLERNGQIIHKCYTEENLAEQIAKNPRLIEERAKLDTQSLLDVETCKASKTAQSVPKIIPVVFHVIHVGGNENISKAQILNALNILNQDFTFTNPDTIGIPAAFRPICGNPNIEFRLAQIDPNGNCTDGITRTFSNYSDNTFDRNVAKSVIQWPPNKYYNIWVVKAISASTKGSTGGVILGFAQFPGLGAASTDGVVLRHDEVGRIGTALSSVSGASAVGRTLTHETGHYLNLRHIWGDNGQCNASDLCPDTPPQRGGTSSPAGCNYGCPTFPLNAGLCTRPHGVGGANVTNTNGDMFFNYMDYVDGSCMKSFSVDQGIRMNAALASSTASRNNLWSASNLTATGVNNVPSVCKPKPYITPFGSLVLCENISQTLVAKSYNATATSYNWTIPGAIYTFGTPTSDSIIINFPTPGTYTAKLVATNASGSDSITELRKFLILKGTSQALYGPNWFESFEDTNNVNNSWTYVNNDKDLVRFKVTNLTSFSGTRCMMINNFNNAGSNLIDELITPNLNMTGTINTGFNLKFRYAYQSQNADDDDRFEVYSTASGACGSPFFGAARLTRIANAAGVQDLNPQPGAVNTSFYVATPADVLEWKEITLTNVIGLVNQANARLKFVFKGGNGNNLFIDDVRFNTNLTTGILDQNLTNGYLDISPNPANNSTTLNYALKDNSKVNITLYNLIGQQVDLIFSGTKSLGEYSDVINLTNYPKGIYMIKMNVNGIITTKKLVVE